MDGIVLRVAPAGMTPNDYVPTRIRAARAADLRHIAPIEDAGGPQFGELFGEAIEPILLSPAMDGRQRAASRASCSWRPPTSGRRSASCTSSSSTATPTSSSSRCCPSHQRQGIGAALTRAAMDEARAPGVRPAQPLHLPRRAVERPVLPRPRLHRGRADLAPYERRLREKERELGLDVNGVRCVMEVALR